MLSATFLGIFFTDRKDKDPNSTVRCAWELFKRARPQPHPKSVMLLGDLGWWRLEHLQPTPSTAVQCPVRVVLSALTFWWAKPCLRSCLAVEPLPETASGSINIVMSIIQTAALGVVTMDKSIPSPASTPVSFPPRQECHWKISKYQHNTYSIQMPTKTWVLQVTASFKALWLGVIKITSL